MKNVVIDYTHEVYKKEYYSPSEIIHLFKTIIIDKDWSFAGYKPSDTSKLTHCYHRYPAKFIPQLVEKIEVYK